MADAPRHLIFACGLTLYGVPAETAAEIVLLPRLTQVPGGPQHLLGVFSLRGELLPVIHLALLLRHEDEALGKRAVVVRTSRGSLALAVDRVLGVFPVEGHLRPVGTAGVERHLLGPGRVPMGEVQIINPGTLVDFLAGTGDAQSVSS